MRARLSALNPRSAGSAATPSAMSAVLMRRMIPAPAPLAAPPPPFEPRLPPAAASAARSAGQARELERRAAAAAAERVARDALARLDPREGEHERPAARGPDAAGDAALDVRRRDHHPDALAR